MQYSDKTIEHFTDPRNVGEITNADGIGQSGSQECGDVIKIWIKVTDDHLADIKYKIFGCPAAIACCSMMSELAMGKHLDDAWELTDDQVAQALDGLPEEKYHCSNLAASTLHNAIMNYILRTSSGPEVSIKVIVNDTVSGNLSCEHGLAIWISYAGKHILFDTGQTDLITQNAEKLNINLADTDAVVLSHGHYDHTGGLPAVVGIAPKANIYLHPAAIKPKFHKKDTVVKYIGISDQQNQAIRSRDMIWTEQITPVLPGMFLTGRIPRINDSESVSKCFFTDPDCKKPDELLDDQALFIDSKKGLIVILGCSHSGVINTLECISNLTGQKKIYAVIGGMHLSCASTEKIEHIINGLKQYDIQKIIPLHCTGPAAAEDIKNAFGEKCMISGAGTQIDF